MKRNWKVLDFNNPLSRTDRYLSWFWGIVTLAYYLIFTIHSYSYDSLTYACNVVSSVPNQQFHPHHLLYCRVNWLFLQLVNLFIHNTGPLITMSWFDSILGALTIVIFYRAAVRLSGKRLVTGLLTAVLVTSRGFHLYSAMPETVIPPIFFLMLAYYLAIFSEGDRIGITFLLAVSFSFAVLFHQNSLVFLPALIGIFWFNRSKRKRWFHFLIFLCSSFLIGAVAYLSVIWLCLGLETTQWMNFATADLHTTLGGFGVWYDWSTAILYWFSVGNSSFISPSEFNWGSLLFVGKILVLGLVVPAVIITILRTIRRELFGAIIVLQLLVAMSFFAWWLVDCEDYWIMPWVMLLTLVAWSIRYINSQIAVIWLCFYLPIGLLTNWCYRISDMVDQSLGRETDRIINFISRNYRHDRTILISERWDLALRAPIVGITGFNWTEESVDFEGFANNIEFTLEKNPESTIICSDYVKNALEENLANQTKKERFAVIFKAIKNAKVLPEFDGTITREKLWVFGNGTENQ